MLFEKERREDRRKYFDRLLERRKIKDIAYKRKYADKSNEVFDDDDTPLHTCMGCNKVTILDDTNKHKQFCEECTTLIRYHVCTHCLKSIDPDEGCDEYGKCTDCSDGNIDYAYGYSGQEYYNHRKDFTTCIQCLKKPAAESSELCKVCTDENIKMSEGQDERINHILSRNTDEYK